jgi:hypothetical protein
MIILFLLGLVVVQAAIAFLSVEVSVKSMVEWFSRVGVGDPIVYRKQKASERPHVRAYDISPAGQGENYTYFVDKYWTVAEVLNNGLIVAVTRTNKRHYLQQDDPNIHRAGLIERMRRWDRFPQIR